MELEIYLFKVATAVVIEDVSGNNMAYFGDGAEVILYHNHNQKLATKDTGVEITGTLDADSANIAILQLQMQSYLLETVQPLLTLRILNLLVHKQQSTLQI